MVKNLKYSLAYQKLVLVWIFRSKNDVLPYGKYFSLAALVFT